MKWDRKGNRTWTGNVGLATVDIQYTGNEYETRITSPRGVVEDRYPKLHEAKEDTERHAAAQTSPDQYVPWRMRPSALDLTSAVLALAKAVAHGSDRQVREAATRYVDTWDRSRGFEPVTIKTS